MAYSIQRAVSDGTLSTIPLDIEFFAKEHITVFVDELLLPNSNYTYQWIGPETIKITPNVAAGKEVLLKRTTPYDKPFHNFKLGAVFKDETMDENFLQTMFITQEAVEGQTSTDFYADLNFHGYRLMNIGNATNATDAVPLVQYQADANGAYQSRVVAEAARVASLASQNAAAASATASSTYASAAMISANNAKASADAAKASENIVVPLAPQVQQAAADAAAASAQAAQASADAKQAVTDVKQLGAVPLGTIILWGLTSTIPAGYLKLDGSTFSKTDYPDLAKLIPSGVLPDWSNRYVKMTGTEAIGSMSGGSMPSHNHTYSGNVSNLAGSLGDILGRVNTEISGIFQKGGEGPIYKMAADGNGDYRGYRINVSTAPSFSGTTSSAGSGNKVEVDRVVAVYIIKAAGKVSDEGLAQVVGLQADVGTLKTDVAGLKTSKADATTVSTMSAKVDEMYTEGGRRKRSVVKNIGTGTNLAFTGVDGIPDWCGKLTIRVLDAQVNGTGSLRVQFYDKSSNLISTGYQGWQASLGNSNATAGSAATTGFQIWGGSTSNRANGHMEFFFDPAGCSYDGRCGGGASQNFGGGRHDSITYTPPGLLITADNGNAFYNGRFQLIFE